MQCIYRATHMFPIKTKFIWMPVLSFIVNHLSKTVLLIFSAFTKTLFLIKVLCANKYWLKYVNEGVDQTILVHYNHSAFGMEFNITMTS